MAQATRSKPKHGEFDIDHQLGEGWFVIRPDGSRDPRSFANRNAALSARGAAATKAAKTARAQVRPCMRCKDDFESEGIHNRMCPRCRHVETAECDPVGYGFGSITGRRT